MYVCAVYLQEFTCTCTQVPMEVNGIRPPGAGAVSCLWVPGINLCLLEEKYDVLLVSETSL